MPTIRLWRGSCGAKVSNLLIETLHQPELERRLDLVPCTSGLHLAALARPEVDIDVLIGHARQAGVGIYSIDEYRYGAGAPRGLLFGYGAIDSAAMKNGLRALRRLLAEAAGQGCDRLSVRPHRLPGEGDRTV